MVKDVYPTTENNHIFWKKSTIGYASKDGRFVIKPSFDDLYGQYNLYDMTKPQSTQSEGILSKGIQFAESISEAKFMAEKIIKKEKEYESTSN